jgi:hypothetical protein
MATSKVNKCLTSLFSIGDHADQINNTAEWEAPRSVPSWLLRPSSLQDVEEIILRLHSTQKPPQTTACKTTTSIQPATATHESAASSTGPYMKCLHNLLAQPACTTCLHNLLAQPACTTCLHNLLAQPA